MKQHDNGDERWADLVSRARRDQAPAIDERALLDVVLREAARTEATGWFAAFCALISRRYLVTSCWACSLALFALAYVQALELLDALPWAQLMLQTTGGVP